MEDNTISLNMLVSSDGYSVYEPMDPSIVFYAGDTLMVTIGSKKITIHRENFGDWTPDDFAKEFLYILEQNFTVRFEEIPVELRGCTNMDHIESDTDLS